MKAILVSVSSLADGDHITVETTLKHDSRHVQLNAGDTAVAVHPEDPRYSHLVGRSCAVPLSDRHGGCANHSKTAC